MVSPFPAPIILYLLPLCNDVEALSHDPGDTFFQSWPVRGETDMNSDLPTFEKIRIPDLTDIFRNPFVAGQISGNVNIPNINPFIRSYVVIAFFIIHILYLA